MRALPDLLVVTQTGILLKVINKLSTLCDSCRIIRGALVVMFDRRGRKNWRYICEEKGMWLFSHRESVTHSQRRLNQTLFPVAGSSNRILTTELLVRGQHTFFLVEMYALTAHTRG